MARHLRLRLVLGLLLACSAELLAHGGGHRRPPPGPPGQVPPGYRKPVPPPTPPTPPGTPPIRPPTTPNPPGGGPQPPQGPAPAPAPTPPAPGGGAPTTPTRPRGGAAGVDRSWRIWWEYNREYLLGLRQRIRDSQRVTITGEGPTRRDPVEHRRDDIRAALRELVTKKATHPQLKASAFIALGRAGTEEDVPVFLAALAGAGDDDEQSAAVLGLGILPPCADPALREAVRTRLEDVIANNPSRRVREFAHIATGLRARHDPRLCMTLARQCSLFVRDSFDGAALAYACGITRDEVLLPEVMLAARNGRLGGVELPDLARSHAVAGIGHLQTALSLDLCVSLLRSRRAGVETRRSAALSLGRLLREMELTEGQARPVYKVLLQQLDKGRDAALRGYCAIALGGARRPQGIVELRGLVDHSGNEPLKAYAALALGLAARGLDEKQARHVRTFLVEELDKCNSAELGPALSLAVGLAGATEGRELLLARVTRTSAPAEVRGAAAEALGLLGEPTPEAAAALRAALADGPADLIEGATLGLGLMGRRGLAPELVKRLEGTSAGILQGSLVFALGHLGEASAVDPLLAVLRDTRQPRVIRELAAVALGLLAAPAEHDALFDLDAWFNPFATTPVTNELLTIF